ncbi:poly(hydroxyalkanoate) depolymerase family esterase [Nocardia tenerifensis]|uniref:Poly(Hydroxyalkanoate) depolymerase family esterase n=1 Tax=Nocardia tenerifensis TaxID=228006 RepID=A0A318K8Y7_9NOCA|nr:PHB depolymerase family esterase [Nocardia tenerifensis]PXX66702.1 poly(hydroxyalkanoate) depolymerase family esterase [Nocardia tenerifensis]
MVPRGRLRSLMLALSALCAQILLTATPSAHATPVVERVFSNAVGARDYYLHVPPGDPTGKPLMVYLHGCTDPQRQLADTGFALTRLADELGFVLAYPIQTGAANERFCWNWFDPANQPRGQGESSIIADLTTALIDEFGLDRARVYVGGYSAGGAMSTVLAAAYPDLYAAIAPMAGGPYQLDPQIFRADLSGASIVSAMGARARPVPGFFLQDLADQTSLYPIGRANLAQWLGAYRLAGEAATPSVPTAVTVNTDPVPTTVERYDTGSCALAEFHTPLGPDHIGGGLLMQSARGFALQHTMMNFLLAHRIGGPRQACG